MQNVGGSVLQPYLDSSLAYHGECELRLLFMIHYYNQVEYYFKKDLKKSDPIYYQALCIIKKRGLLPTVGHIKEEPLMFTHDELQQLDQKLMEAKRRMAPSESTKKILVLFSGGLDSTVLVAWLQCLRRFSKIGLLNFNYGSKHNVQERYRARHSAAVLGLPMTELNITFLKDVLSSALLQGGGDVPSADYDRTTMKQTNVPFRNGIMLALAAGIAESQGYDYIALSNHSGDHYLYPDCRPNFIYSMADAIKHGTEKQLSMISPFCHMSKAEIVFIGHLCGVDLANTYSCYKGGKIHCGVCGTCRERQNAFLQAGVVDHTVYERAIA